MSKPEARRDVSPREWLMHPNIPEFPDEPKFGMDTLMFTPSKDAHMPNLA